MSGESRDHGFCNDLVGLESVRVGCCGQVLVSKSLHQVAFFDHPLFLVFASQTNLELSPRLLLHLLSDIFFRPHFFKRVIEVFNTGFGILFQ